MFLLFCVKTFSKYKKKTPEYKELSPWEYEIHMLAFTFLGDGPKNSVEIERTNEVKGEGDCSDPFGNIITTISTKKNMSRLGSHIVTPYQAT